VNNEKRRVATTNRSQVSITVECKRNFLTCSLITIHNLVVVSDNVRAHLGGPKNLGDAGDPSTVDGPWLTLKNAPTPHVM